ncbi:MAG: hypothetical protein H7301_07610 [Cryobacterium sp.]|nr:hypothetical protein [Oligoflexia bacterium]
MSVQVKNSFAVLAVMFGVFSGCNDTGFSSVLSQKQSDQIAPVSDPSVPALPPSTSTLCEDHPEAPACSRAPVVTSAGVVTILFTVSQIPDEAANLIMTNAVKYASPVANPKILFLKDSNTHGEDEGDSDYIKNALLAGYQVEYRVIMPGGLRREEVTGKDLVIVSNPGHPLSDEQTLSTLKSFSGGVILVGDDMSNGAGFSLESFTGLRFRDNGSSLSCNGQSFSYDNQGGYQYRVTMNSEFLPGIPEADKHYTYGNDLDLTEALPGVQVLASAIGAAGTCDIAPVPAVVRRTK